jgi:hypothetical protein
MLPGLEKLMIMRVVLNEKLKRTKSKIYGEDEVLNDEEVA